MGMLVYRSVSKCLLKKTVTTTTTTVFFAVCKVKVAMTRGATGFLCIQVYDFLVVQLSNEKKAAGWLGYLLGMGYYPIIWGL